MLCVWCFCCVPRVPEPPDLFFLSLSLSLSRSLSLSLCLPALIGLSLLSGDFVFAFGLFKPKIPRKDKPRDNFEGCVSSFCGDCVCAVFCGDNTPSFTSSSCVFNGRYLSSDNVRFVGAVSLSFSLCFFSFDLSRSLSLLRDICTRTSSPSSIMSSSSEKSCLNTEGKPNADSCSYECLRDISGDCAGV